jgi:hypothetical protein
MTTTRTSNNATVTVRPLDVLGIEFRGFLFHSMLCDEPADRSDVNERTRVRVAHMRPPIAAELFRCHVVSGIALTERERTKIRRFVDRFRKEMEANAKQLELAPNDPPQTLPSEPRYLIHPERLTPRAGSTLWSYSCVGFVISAYRNGRITLLSPNRPLKTLEDLKLLYPDRAEELDDPDKRAEYLPEGGDSWPVALVGYLFNAFNRSDEEVRQTPFQPQLGDEHFPSQRPPSVPSPTTQ